MMASAIAPDGAEIPYFVIEGADKGKNLLLIAGVHGDEYEGVAALQDLGRSLNGRVLKGRVTIVPVANPTSFYAGTRCYPIDQGDLNRSFPGRSDGRPVERLAFFLFNTFVVGQHAILSMHGWSREADVISYVEYPAGACAAAKSSKDGALDLGLRFAHPYEWERGLLVRAALDQGIASVETEIGGCGTISREGQVSSKSAASRFLAHWGAIPPGDDGGSSKVDLVQHQKIVATARGLLRLTVDLNEQVATGQTIGSVYGLSGELMQTLCSERDGFIGMLRGFASVKPGDLIAQIFFPAN